VFFDTISCKAGSGAIAGHRVRYAADPSRKTAGASRAAPGPCHGMGDTAGTIPARGTAGTDLPCRLRKTAGHTAHPFLFPLEQVENVVNYFFAFF
jgi:hypothetical protein